MDGSVANCRKKGPYIKESTKKYAQQQTFEDRARLLKLDLINTFYETKNVEEIHTEEVIGQWKQLLRDMERETEKAKEKYKTLRKKSYYDNLKQTMILKEKQKEYQQSKLEKLKENLRLLAEIKKDLGIEDSSKITFKNAVREVEHIYEDGSQNTDPFKAHFNEGHFDSDEPHIVESIRNYFKYINTFESLFHEKKYKSAVTQVLQSPGSVLISLNIFNMFKKIDDDGEYNKDSSPLMFLCNGLMKCSSTKHKLPEKLCVEMIRCALKYRNIMIIRSWLCKDHFTLSVNAGKLLMESCLCQDKCSCDLITLALSIFLKLDIPRFACFCYLRLHCFKSMMIMAEKSDFTKTEYRKLFTLYPSTKLFHVLNEKCLIISLLSATSALLSHDNKLECWQLLNDVYHNGSNGRSFYQVFLTENESIFIMNDECKELIRFLEDEHSENILILEEALSCIAMRKAIETSSIKHLTSYFS